METCANFYAQDDPRSVSRFQSSSKGKNAKTFYCQHSTGQNEQFFFLTHPPILQQQSTASFTLLFRFPFLQTVFSSFRENMNSKPVKGEQGPDGPSSAKRSKIPNKSLPPPEGAAGGDWDWDSKGLMVAGEGLGILLKREDGNRKFGHLEKFVTKEKGRTCVDTSNVIGTICLIKKGSVIRKEEGNLVSVGKGAIMDIMVVKKLEIPAGMLKERWIPGVGFVNEEDEETAESVDSEVSLEGDE